MTLAGVTVTAVLLLAAPDALVGVFYDDGIYAALAKSLAEGDGYRLTYLPGSPAGVHYPFGYPAFLAALWLVWPSFPDNVMLLRGANAVLLGLFAALTTGYAHSRLRLPDWVAALAVTTTCLLTPMLTLATVLFSEPLFLVLAVSALWLADANANSPRWQMAVLAGLLAGCSQLTRSIGVAVVFGVVAAFAFARQYSRAAIAGAVAVLVVLPWILWTRAHWQVTDPAIVANYGTYSQFLDQGGSGLLSLASLGGMARPLMAVALPPIGAAAIVAGLVCLAVLALGWWQLKPARGLQCMLVAYFAVILSWPYGPDRFLWAVLPFLVLLFVAGVRALWSWTGSERDRKLARGLALAAAVPVAAGLLRTHWTGITGDGHRAAQEEISASFREVLPWIREQTPASAVIATEDEALIYLYTGRRAVPSYLWQPRGHEAMSSGPDSLRAWLDRTGASHLMLMGPGSDAAPTIDAMLARFPGYLRVVRSWPWPILAFEIQRRG